VRRPTSIQGGVARSVLLLLGCTALYLLAAALTSNSYFLLIMTLVPIWATVGVSWNIFSGYSGLLSFGHAAFFGIGAYTVAVLFAQYGISPWLGIPLAGVAGGAAGLLIGLPTFRLRGVYFSLAMLAYPLAMLYVFEWLGLQEIALPLMRENPAAYMQFRDYRIYIALAVALLLTALAINLAIARSRFGLTLLAIKQNELAAEAAGIDPFRWKLRALVISGAFAGVAGGLYAVVLVVVTPHSVFGMLVSAQALIFTMFGGVGWIAGPVVGALVLLPLGELFTATLGASLPGIQGVIYGCAIILVVLMAPEGVMPWLASRMGGKAAPMPSASSPSTAMHAAPAAPGPLPAFGPAGDDLLVVRGLSRRFGGLQAVQDVTFTVRRHEILGIIGPNGAGKTTMFNLLNGIIEPSSGSVMFEGRELTGLRPWQVCRLGVGRTFQVVRAFSRLTVLENVKIGALTSEPNGALAQQRALDALALTGMSAQADALAANLPAVQLRLMEVARALASRPRLLLLDEVLAGLGKAEVDRVFQVLVDIKNAGITIVIIEHTMHAMVRLADRLLVLDQGKVLYVGQPEAVTSDPTVIEAYLGKKWARHVEN